MQGGQGLGLVMMLRWYIFPHSLVTYDQDSGGNVR